MYRGRLQRDLTLWVGQGLIDAKVADALLRELDSRESSFSVGRVLVVIAAILVSAAILLLVASNWEAIPRLLRVGMIVALLWIFHAAAAVLLVRGVKAVAAAMLILGTLTFGGGISLVGQMYHLSGDTLTVMVVWFAMACISAALFRSAAVTVIAGFLAWGYFGFFIEEYSLSWDGLAFTVPPLMSAIVLGLVYYTGAIRARHLVYLLMTGWLTWLYFLHEDVVTAMLLVAAGAVGFLLAAVPQSPLAAMARRAGPAPAFYTFLLLVIALAILHVEFDDIGSHLALGIVTLGAAVTAIALSGRDNGAVRYLGYAVFASELLYLSFETVGTILGTSGFFLLSGLLVAVVAWLVTRLERRLSGRSPQKEARP